MSAEEKLNQSYENLEYTFSNAFRKLTLKEKKKVGLLTEFTSLQPINFAGLIGSLQEYYDLYFVDAATSESFVGLDALILPKPDRRIDDSTKFKIDQYIMNGGKALFFMDGLSVDSIGLQGTFAQPYQHNLEDLFFKYGVRINANIIKDGASATMVPLVVGNIGDKPNIQPIPYRFFPLINDFGESLITKNLDLIRTKFVSSIDTVASKSIVKTPLLNTTPYTKVLNAPALVTYNDARSDTDEQEYNHGKMTIAYLLEGNFTSLYQNRILPSDPRSAYFKSSSEPTKIIVCSDGDLIVNDIDRKSGQPLPLGFDKVTQHVFGNKDFVMNAVDYLVDENGVINARGKEVKRRPLDAMKTRDDRSQIQIVNLLIPSLLIILFAFLRGLYWRRKYAS
jgi:ABC-2 type transport system permease protein